MGLIIDNFAGGGGASTGIEAALGRPIDIAINHDPEAVAMHRVNHPETLHLCQSVWLAEPAEVCRGRPVDFAWFSPDCKHFSKAKGGKPVEKNIRDLAWVVVKWAQLPPELRPKVFMLENVEEFRTWGPLTDAGLPCPDRQGETFNLWKGALEQQDYQVEFRELRACDYGGKVLGSPATIRKRLYGIGRCDGLPIVWPEPTHGAPDDPDVIAGRKQPWRVAANILDFTLPCPSIFETSEEIFRTLGLRTKRPLAEATLRRIARGVVRYVLEAPRPFIVGVGGRMGQTMERGVEQPMNTGTAKEDAALIMPFVSYAQQGGANRSAVIPTHTFTASRKDHNCLVAAFLAQHNTGSIGQSPSKPVSTLVSKPGIQTVVATNLVAVNHGDSGGRREYDTTDPLGTLTARRGEGLIATHLQTLRGSNRRDQATEAPLRTVSAGGNHSALIAAFMTKYYSTGENSFDARSPMHTDRVKDSHGLVTVQINGETYAITDIGMRMLTPRERFRAQGFPESYIIDHGIDEAGQRMPLTLDAQGRMCGNSVCPPLAEALVRANMAEAEATLEAA